MIEFLQYSASILFHVIFILYVLIAGRNIFLSLLFLLLFNPLGALLVFVLWDMLKAGFWPFGKS